MTGSEAPVVLVEKEDLDLLQAFEDCSLPEKNLDHACHVRVAWAYLQRAPLFEALVSIQEGLVRYTRFHGAENKYNATITCAYALAVYERIQRRPASSGWSRFAADHPALFEPHLGFLKNYYRPETLASEEARRSFVLPDRPRRRPASDEEALAQ